MTAAALVVAAFAAFYTYLSYIPLFYTDIWGHVSYGKWMLEHRALPTEDPFLPLSKGMRVIDSSWLSQLLLGWGESWNGAEALVLMFAVTSWCTYLILCRAFYLLSGRIWLAQGRVAEFRARVLRRQVRELALLFEPGSRIAIPVMFEEQRVVHARFPEWR